MKRGFLISFEGIDGSGKTTQIQLLKEYLINKGFNIEIIENSKISKKLMEIFLDPESEEMYPKTELLLHSTIHAQDIQELVLPALNQKKIVIINRFLDASIAYQGYGRELDFKDIKWLNEFTANGLEPDVTILLDINPLIAIERMKKSGKRLDKIEKKSLDFHRRVRNGYLKIAENEPERIKVINATKSINEIQTEIREFLEKRLSL